MSLNSVSRLLVPWSERNQWLKWPSYKERMNEVAMANECSHVTEEIMPKRRLVI
jgi:hypothetical protein